MLVYGRNIAIEYLNKDEKIKKIILQENFSDKKLNFLLEKHKSILEYMSKNEMDSLCAGVHQGIILDVMDYQYTPLNDLLKSDAQFVVILDHLEDPHNFGAIIRTCECAGVDYIIIPKNRSVSVNSTVYKTSSGALNNVKIIEVVNLNNTIKKLKTLGFWVYGSDALGKDYRSIKYDSKTCLIIGSEGHGLKKIVSNSCDEIISIPMKGKVNSLNASVASGILIYEIMKYK